MTTPPPTRTAAPSTWTAYVEGLAAVHRARDAAVTAHHAARREDAARREAVTRLTARAAHQQQAFRDLAARLRVTLTPADLTPVPAPAGAPTGAPAGAPSDAVADLRARLDTADAGLAETRRVAALPQLLPDWPSALARAAVVYAAIAAPNLLLTLALKLAGGAETFPAVIWLAIVWPVVTAFAGGSVVPYVGRPRIAATSTGQASSTAATGGRSGYGRREPRYRWLGMLLALAFWYGPVLVLDGLGSLWPGG